ncbi:MAG: methylisocitrate lyase [Phycisphaerales bacterium]|nr:isocitrate lyase/phosphoenolpyruvate mutase family protein [Phycisphaerae bacterium]NNF43422.1 methylisocitrate lyase [Phycisphaerales bacterium]NNM26329.1 methylisocitrate lyase [Phycisphaerales bacterium]
MPTHPGRLLRDAMTRATVVCPGAFNALVARAIARAGFEACYISGGATANVAGYPDVGLITLTEMARTIREISDASGLPVVADADTGYGEVECVKRTVVEYERAGAAALHLEDQVFPKRCGHLDGKTLLPTADMVEKIRAASEHRPDDAFVIIARTDARGIEGLNAAVERAAAYRAAGADMVFPEGLTSSEEFAAFAKASPGLLLANMTEFGKTPDITSDEFASLGYDLVIYPLSMMRLAMGHVTRGLAELKERGTVAGLLPAMQTRKELYELLEYVPGEEWPFPGGGAGG